MFKSHCVGHLVWAILCGPYYLYNILWVTLDGSLCLGYILWVNMCGGSHCVAILWGLNCGPSCLIVGLLTCQKMPGSNILTTFERTAKMVNDIFWDQKEK